jgi:hypothetical protein
MKWHLLVGLLIGILALGVLPDRSPIIEKPLAYSPTVVPSGFVDVTDNP